MIKIGEYIFEYYSETETKITDSETGKEKIVENDDITGYISNMLLEIY